MVDTSEITNAQLLNWVNECIHDVAMRDDWPWLEGLSTFATVASTQNYDLDGIASSDYPSQVRFLILSGDDEPLLPISFEQAIARWGDDVTTGEPKYYYIYNEDFYLCPIPDAVYTVKVFYIKEPADLASGTDVPPWHASFHPVAVSYLEGKIWEQQEDFVKSKEAFDTYFDRVDLMKRTYRARTNYGPWAIGAGRSTFTGRSEPFRDNWGLSDVAP